MTRNERINKDPKVLYYPQEMVEAAGEEEKELAAQVAAEFLNEDIPDQQFGAPKAGCGMWASVLRVLDPIKVSGLVEITEVS